VARKRKKRPSKLDQMLERYGFAAFVTWFGIFFSTIALFYMLLEVGTDVDAMVASMVGWWGGDPSGWTEQPEEVGVFGRIILSILSYLPAQLGIAYLAAQVVKPIRVVLFVALTPVVARWMGKQPQPETPEVATGGAEESSGTLSEEEAPTEAG
jgi:hypothetical protein